MPASSWMVGPPSLAPFVAFCLVLPAEALRLDGPPGVQAVATATSADNPQVEAIDPAAIEAARARMRAAEARRLFGPIASKIRDVLPHRTARTKRLVAIGWDGITAKEFDRAIAALDEAISLDPAYAPAYLARGLAWHHKWDLDRALADYAEVIRLDPNELRGHVYRGMALETVKDNGNAFDAYSEAIRADPDSPVPYMGRARVRLKLGDGRGALEDVERALPTVTTGEAVRLLITALDVTGDDENLLTVLKALIDNEPDNPEHHAALALLLASSRADHIRDPKAALASARRADELAGGRSRAALRARAAALAASGDFPGALFCQLRVIVCGFTNLDAATDVDRLTTYLLSRPFRKQAWQAEPRGRHSRQLRVGAGIWKYVGLYLVLDLERGFSLRGGFLRGLPCPMVVVRWNPRGLQFPRTIRSAGRPTGPPPGRARPGVRAAG